MQNIYLTGALSRMRSKGIGAVKLKLVNGFVRLVEYINKDDAMSDEISNNGDSKEKIAKHVEFAKNDTPKEKVAQQIEIAKYDDTKEKIARIMI